MVKLQALNVPIRPGVPKWLGFATTIAIMLPLVLINGVYTGDITEVSGSLGIMSEDIRMAYYATSVGMAVCYPLIPKIKRVLTTKTVLLADFIIQIFLCLLCAHANQIDIITVCSFFIGFFKGFAMMEFILIIRPFFTPNNVRSEFYSFFYPIVYSGGQISMALTAQLAYSYQWQHMYYLVIILLLVAIIFVLLFFRYTNRVIHIPFKEIDGKSILLISTALLLTIYAATYGKTLDWFASTRITTYVILIPILLWLFVHRQQTMEQPYLRLEVLYHWKTIVGYIFITLGMFFASSSSLIVSYSSSILRVGSVHTNMLYLWMLPGFIAGAIICFWWFRWQRWRFRILISIGMLCFTIYFAILYFQMMPEGSYEVLRWSSFFRGIGMMIMFIAFGVYVVEELNPKLMIFNAFFLIVARSALAPALSACFYNNVLYHLQQKAMFRLSENMTMDNVLASAPYTQSLNSAIAQGHNMGEAIQMATNSLYSTLQTQGLLLSLKTLIGYLLISALVLAAVALFIPFHKTVKVAVVKTGEDMV